MPRSRRARRVHQPRATSGDRYLRSSWRVAGVWLLALDLAAVALFFDPLALTAFSVPKATLTIALSAALVTTLAVLLGRFGRTIWRRSAVDVAVATVLISYVIATALALNPVVALLGSYENAVGLMSVLHGALIYAAVVTLLRTRKDAVVVASGLFLPVIPVFAYAGVQYAGLDPVPWEIGYPTIGTFGNPGVLSQYLGTLGVAALTAAVVPGVARNSAERRFLLLTAAAAILGTLLSGTRVALIGFALTAVAVGPIVLARAVAPHRRRRAQLVYVLGLAIAAAAIAATPQARSLPALVSTISQPRSEASVGSAAARLSLYEIAFEQIRDRPAFGVGPDNFVVAYGRYRTPEARLMTGSEALESSTHSWVLHVATDAGLIGLASYLALAAISIIAALRPASSPSGLPAVAALAFFLGAGLFSVNDAGTEWLPWMAFAVASISLRSRPEVLERLPGRMRPGLDRAVTWGAVALVALSLLWTLQLLGAGNSAGRAAGARAAGQLDSAVAHGEDAAARAPFRAEYWHELGLARAGRREFAESTAAFARAVELAPHDAVYLSNLAEANVGLFREGDATALNEALRVSERAVDADPNRSLVHYTRALVLHTAGRAAEAAAESERGRSLAAPNRVSAYQVAARAYLALDREQDALRWLDEALTRYWPVPASTDLRLLRVEALIAAGDRPAARDQIVQLLALELTDPRIREFQRVLED